jgi:hypothetical protein
MHREAVDRLSVLLGFSVENVRCFKQPAEMSLGATAQANPGAVREIPWRADGRTTRVVPAAGIFGANASGKTMFLEAIDDMRMYVLDSFRRPIEPGEHWPFVLDPACAASPSRYEIEIVLDGIKTEYGFVLGPKHVHEEWAYRYPSGRANLLFRRIGDDVDIGPTGRSETRATQRLLRKDALLLSAAGAADHEVLGPLYAWFQRNLQMATSRNRDERQALTTKMLDEPPERERVLDMLRAADLGIVDATKAKVAIDPQLQERLTRAVRELAGEEARGGEESEVSLSSGLAAATQLMLVHRGDASNVPLPLGVESQGTRVWLGLIGSVLSALDGGSALVVDELEASLHPALVAQIIRLFQDQDTNRNRAQLIFNSHDPMVLGDSSEERLLGRDQIWFTEKGSDGSSQLYPLTEFAPRKNEAISRRYLQGRYGATPVLSHGDFERILVGPGSTD